MKPVHHAIVHVDVVLPMVMKPIVRVRQERSTLMANSFLVSRERDRPCSILSFPSACKNVAFRGTEGKVAVQTVFVRAKHRDRARKRIAQLEIKYFAASHSSVPQRNKTSS